MISMWCMCVVISAKSIAKQQLCVLKLNDIKWLDAHAVQMDLPAVQQMCTGILIYPFFIIKKMGDIVEAKQILYIP